jgi:solute carrier family 32 (vesicular inhibitory amino acid transporter)
MHHPHKYGSALTTIFSFVTTVDVTAAVIGYLMFGSTTGDEFTTNVLDTPGYPEPLKVVVLVLIAIVPLTKFPLK